MSIWAFFLPLIGMIINAGGQEASWVLQLPLCCFLWEPHCPTELRAKSMALIWTAAESSLQTLSPPPQEIPAALLKLMTLHINSCKVHRKEESNVSKYNMDMWYIYHQNVIDHLMIIHVFHFLLKEVQLVTCLKITSSEWKKSMCTQLIAKCQPASQCLLCTCKAVTTWSCFTLSAPPKLQQTMVFTAVLRCILMPTDKGEMQQ